MSSVTAPLPAVNPKLIVPFIASVKSVLKTMLNIELELGKIGLKTTPAPSYDVSAIVGFSGQIIGSVVVSFQKGAAEKLASAFAGSSMKAADPDFADAIGELGNMIAGGAKTNLGLVANITVPNVVIGSGHVIARLRDVPCVVVPCKTPAGDFAVEINVKEHS